jgi:hypothetical protein
MTTLRDTLFGSDDEAQRERSNALKLKIQHQHAVLEPADQDEFDALEAAMRVREADYPARMRFAASGTIIVPRVNR